MARYLHPVRYTTPRVIAFTPDAFSCPLICTATHGAVCACERILACKCMCIASYPVQLVVEATRVADRMSVSGATPERRLRRLAV